MFHLLNDYSEGHKLIKIPETALEIFKLPIEKFNSLKPTFFQQYLNAGFIYIFLKIIVIPVIILVILLLILSLLSNRYKSEQLDFKKKKIDATLNDFLTELIFSDFNTEEIKQKIAEFKGTIPYQEKWCRYLILNKLIQFKQNLHGFDQNRILLIYKYFDLQQYSQRLLNDKRWYFKSLGIYHYQVLDYKIKKGHMKSFLKSKNKYLRSNALVAVIALSDEKFGVLDNYQDRISRADELKILDIIYQKQSEVPENIELWLQHKNNSIVLLALKLVIRYKVNLNLSQITYLLMHDDALVRKETLLAIRELKIVQANQLLLAHYSKENHKRNRISCLKTLGVIGNDETLEFAQTLLPEENDLEIKFELVSCIHKLDAFFFDDYTIEDLNQKSLIHKIALHVKNPYLN
ncbi:hypothetical protein LZZ90_10195 [Flavobacterium sp. SM15]|uniref:hypothetical protein n=1 Tax=Flavobacterium sp. SM15 TaxID=2908005 RepID=UPI001EDB08B3|nr:hypothetical protein [Flavobacterium sp. SM15]MCG2611875.1 hypothetical protein [Flavobacterium sp. SM15]